MGIMEKQTQHLILGVFLAMSLPTVAALHACCSVLPPTLPHHARADDRTGDVQGLAQDAACLKQVRAAVMRGWNPLREGTSRKGHWDRSPCTSATEDLQAVSWQELHHS